METWLRKKQVWYTLLARLPYGSVRTSSTNQQKKEILNERRHVCSGASSSAAISHVVGVRYIDIAIEIMATMAEIVIATLSMMIGMVMTVLTVMTVMMNV